MATERKEPGYYRGKWENALKGKGVELGYFKIKQSDDCIFIEIGPSSYNLVKLKRPDAEWLRDILDSYLKNK